MFAKTILRKDTETNECRIRMNERLESLWQKTYNLSHILKRLQLSGHVWRNEIPVIHTVLEMNLTGEDPLDDWYWVQDVVNKYVEELWKGVNWIVREPYRDDWKIYREMIVLYVIILSRFIRVYQVQRSCP